MPVKGAKVPITHSDLANFRRYVTHDANGCWYWTGRHDKDGYPAARLSGREVRVHRWSLEAHKGPAPGSDYQAGHMCHDRAVAEGTCSGDRDRCPHRSCVNPAHLEWQTASTNTDAQAHANRAKTHCPRGHEFTPENTRVRRGRRECRTCIRLAPRSG